MLLLLLLLLLLQSLHMLRNPRMYGIRRHSPRFNAFAEELLKEARLLRSLSHENVVLVRGVIVHPEHGHVQWLVTEHANGGSLAAWLSRRGHMTFQELLGVLLSVTRGLAYLHSRLPVAVLHRDIKPANVLVFITHGGGLVWKLADVGLAKVLEASIHGHTAAGSPFYTAPDVLLGPYDGKVDVFSMGIMAAELVVRYVDIEGFAHVDADTWNDVQSRGEMATEACERLNHVCPALSDFVRRCTAMAAVDRMCSDAARDALELIRGGGGGEGEGEGEGGRDGDDDDDDGDGDDVDDDEDGDGDGDGDGDDDFRAGAVDGE